MYYIRPCSNCKTELRFPLNKGTLLISCPSCKTQFKINPDDPETFRYGKFEYSLGPVKTARFRTILDAVSDLLFIPIDLFHSITRYRFKSSNSGFSVMKIIPFILFTFLFLNLYRLCLNPSPEDAKKKEEWKIPKPSDGGEDLFEEEPFQEQKELPETRPQYEI